MSEAEAENSRRRVYVDTVADLYDEVRPRYPESLFDSLVTRCGLTAETPVLEVGAGTGIATLPLARRGLSVVALEPGAALRTIAAHRLREYPGVRLSAARLEAYEPEGPAPQALISAQAFHWVSPEQRYVLADRLLAAGGRLALLGYHEPLDSPFYALSRPAYEAVYGTTPPPDVPARIEQQVKEIYDSGLFVVESVEGFSWKRAFPTAHMVKLLTTDSDIGTLSAEARTAFLGDIRRRIDQAGGSVELRQTAVLTIACRKADARRR